MCENRAPSYDLPAHWCRHLAHGLGTLAWFYKAQGRYAEAEPHYQRALAILEKVLGPDHPDVALSLNLVGTRMHAYGARVVTTT